MSEDAIETMRVKQALFLVGGKGTRLGSLTSATPKPLLEIAPNVTFLDVLIEQFSRHGFSDIILLAGHMAEQFQSRYHLRQRGGATITVVCEPEPAGTGGALHVARNHLDEWFVMSNGDSYFDINLRSLTKPTAAGTVGRLALRQEKNAARFGTVEVQGQRVTAFREKQAGLEGGRLINAGVYLLNRGVVDAVSQVCSLERDVFPGLARAGQLEGRVFDGYFLDMGLPDTYQLAKRDMPGRRQRPVAFFDRDGVLNADHGYTHRVADLKWINGAREAILLLNEAGYLVIVVTNQGGIGLGHYGLAAMQAFHERMQNDLAATGAHIDAFYHCPHHPDATTANYRHADHPDRKPNPGMILRALEEWPVRHAGSFLVGDRDSDVTAATRAGIPGYLFDGVDVFQTVSRILQDQKR